MSLPTRTAQADRLEIAAGQHDGARYLSSVLDAVTAVVGPDLDWSLAQGDYSTAWIAVDFPLAVVGTAGAYVRVFTRDLDCCSLGLIVLDRYGVEEARATFDRMSPAIVAAAVISALQS